MLWNWPSVHNLLSLFLFSVHFNGHFPGEPGLAGYIEAMDDGGGGDNWSYKSCKAPVKSSPPTNQHPTFYRPDALHVANQQCESTEGKNITFHGIAHPSPSCLPHLSLSTNSSWLSPKWNDLYKRWPV